MSEYMIETHNLTKKYGEQTSVSNLDLHVKKGRIYGLLGRNGHSHADAFGTDDAYFWNSPAFRQTSPRK